MDINQFLDRFPDKLKQLQEFVHSTRIKRIVGREAVRHFHANFDNEGFIDERLNPWKDVKRRDPNSPWYGYSSQRRKYSNERTTAPILTGETRELRNAIRYKYLPNGVRVLNEKPYARVHQEGGTAYIYGKKKFTMPARPFIGKSVVLTNNIKKKISREFIKIMSE